MKHLLFSILMLNAIISSSQIFILDDSLGNIYTTCNAVLYDDGGPAGQYSNNVNNFLTFYTGSNNTYEVEVVSFNIENGWDFFYIYDGQNTGSPLIGIYTGTTIPSIVYTSGPYVTFQFIADGSVAADGFEINITCSSPPNVFGYLFNDVSNDCIMNPTEEVGGILIYTDPGNYCSYTDSNGFYQLYLDPGNYSVYTAVSSLFDVSCPPAGYQTVTVTNPNDSITGIDIGIIANDYCPLLDIQASAAAFRPCFPSIIHINYQNIGTLAEPNPYVEVELDSNLIYSSSSIPYSSVNGNVYTFLIDTLDVFESGGFSIIVNVTCNVSLIGQTECVNTIIYPQNLCSTPIDSLWDHSSVMVTGSCVGDSLACFIITNTGDLGNGDMQNQHEYRIFANDTLVFTGYFQLQGQESIEICWPTDGRAIRLEADQHPAHPGNSHPQETIEDCGDYTGSSLGYITTNIFDDEDIYIDIFCLPITGSMDPNEKMVQPEGITDNHYIENDVELTYQINFQNTGTDTAFTVVIRDTLSDMHDITTFQNGVSSHNCVFTIRNDRVLEWTFNNILLPDSNVNEPASHGFVTYTVRQKTLTTGDYGTHITNNAAIYFDFNPAVITNTTDLIFWDLPIVITEKEIINSNNSDCIIYPNPTSGQINIIANEIEKVEVLNIQGRRLYKGIEKQIDLNNYAKGIYLIKVTTNKGVAVEKVVLE